MIEILQSDEFRKWRIGLKDRHALFRINVRLERIMDGNFGDVKSVGGSIAELRIDYGPGYRVYFMRQGTLLVILLAGGDKRTQAADIRKAQTIAERWKEASQ